MKHVPAYRKLCIGIALLFSSVTTSAQMSGHTYTSESIETGFRIYVQNCTLCHGPGGARIQDINLARGIFRNVVTDEDLRRVVSNGTAEGRMPAFNLSETNLSGLIAFIRTGFEPPGNPISIGDINRGEKLFQGKGDCSKCHRIHGLGLRTAPDLSDIGLIRTPGALQRSLLAPSTALLPINRTVTIVTRDDETITGRRLNEDTYTVQLIDSKERLRSLIKTDFKSYRISETSIHKPVTLSSDEVADFIAYLLSLRG